MKTISKKCSKKLFFMLIVLLSAGINEIKAQDKYAFATWTNAGLSNNDDAFYLVVSDPVKNWFDNMNEEERKEWQNDFRISANKQIGYSIMGNYKTPIPEGGSYERFTSLSQCNEAIQSKIQHFKKYYAGYNKPVKIIYVNLRKN